MFQEASYIVIREQIKNLYGTPELFNEKFDVQTGEETVSLWVKPGSIRLSMLGHLTQHEDPRSLLAYFACCWIGRTADLVRCRAVATKQRDNGWIEIRLRFGPPWYWGLINEQLKKTDA